MNYFIVIRYSCMNLEGCVDHCSDYGYIQPDTQVNVKLTKIKENLNFASNSVGAYPFINNWFNNNIKYETKENLNADLKTNDKGLLEYHSAI